MSNEEHHEFDATTRRFRSHGSCRCGAAGSDATDIAGASTSRPSESTARFTRCSRSSSRSSGRAHQARTVSRMRANVRPSGRAGHSLTRSPIASPASSCRGVRGCSGHGSVTQNVRGESSCQPLLGMVAYRSTGVSRPVNRVWPCLAEYPVPPTRGGDKPAKPPGQATRPIWFCKWECELLSVIVSRGICRGYSGG